MTQSVTISSSAAASSIIDLNPVFKETIMQVTVSAGSSGTSFVQFTLDDPNAAGSTVTWANLSSAIISSNADGLGQTLAILSPLSGLRLSCVTTSTSGGVFSGTTTLKVLQSVTG